MHPLVFSVFLIACFPVLGICGELEYLQGAGANYTEAVMLCENENMSLAKIENKTEHDRVRDFIGYEEPVTYPQNRRLLGGRTPEVDIWIGLYYLATSETFFWISDGTEANYTPWIADRARLEPSNLPPNGSRTHVVLSAQNKYDFKTANDQDRYDVLCEESDLLPGTTTDPSATNTGISNPLEGSMSKGDHTAIIVGSVAGSLVLLSAVAGAAYCCLKKPLAGVKKRRSNKEKENDSD